MKQILKLTEEIDHPFRSKLLERSKALSGKLHKYKIGYFEGNVYNGINLKSLVISAHNLIEAYVILSDYLEKNFPNRKDYDYYEETFEDGNLTIDEDDMENDTLWVERI